jgi:IS5 family transposase
MLAGFFEGIVHDRKLMRQAEVNIAIRWFAGYELGQHVPHHSSLTRIRQRWGAERFKRIFQRTVAACMQAGLVDAETVHVDATLMRANVSWESLSEEHADSVLEQDQEAAEQDEKPAPKAGTKRRGRHPKRRRRTRKKRSRTDPDASMTTSNSKQRMRMRYKQHTAVDGKSGVILDADVTTGEASEGSQLPEQIERIEETTGKKIKTLTADAGYSSGRNYEALEQRGTEAVIPPQRRGRRGRGMPLERFTYDGKHETVRCPGGKMLIRGHATDKGVWYRARRADCAGCALRSQCVPATATSRSVLILHGYAALLRARRRRGRWDDAWQAAYRGHRCRVEGVHGEAKTQHGLGRAVRWGLANMAIQAYLTAAVINLKRLAAFHWRSVCGPLWLRQWFHGLLHSVGLLRRLLKAKPSAIMPPTPA